MGSGRRGFSGVLCFKFLKSEIVHSGVYKKPPIHHRGFGFAGRF